MYNSGISAMHTHTRNHIHQILCIFNSLILTDFQYFNGLCINCGVIVLGWNAAMSENSTLGFRSKQGTVICITVQEKRSLSCFISLVGKTTWSLLCYYARTCVCLVVRLLFYSTKHPFLFILNLICKGFYSLFTDSDHIYFQYIF